MKKVLYPGSFDPITKGHMSIIEQASNLFDEIIIAVQKNSLKEKEFFVSNERIEIIKEIYKDKSNVKVILGEGASVDVALDNGCSAIIRGLRTMSDFDYEIQMACFNRDISNKNINTICLFADLEYQFVSSSMVKELFYLNKDISKYVDIIVKKRMNEKNRY